MNNLFRHIIQMLLISDFLLLPFAHLKITLFGLPLYALEIPILAAALLFLYGVLRGMPPLRIPLFSDTVLSIGIVCFIGGTLLSFITNPFSLTGLGLIKSWFLFPLIAAMLWSAISDTAADTKKIFTSWFIAASGIALGALAFLSIGHLTYDHRLEAWYTSPNFLAVILASGLIVGVFILSSLFEKHASTKKVFLIAIGVTLIAIALFFTRSYGAWGALSISLSVFSLSTTSRETRRIILFIGIAALSIYALSESGSAKWHALLSLDERSSLASRAMIWNSAITIITDHPVIGIGVGRFQETYLAYQRFFPPYLEWAVPEPHNLLLALWLETGVLGLVGFLIITVRIASLLIVGIAHKKKEKMSRSLILCLMLFFLLYGILDTPYFGNDLAFLWWMLVASGVHLSKNQSDTDDSSVDQ